MQVFLLLLKVLGILRAKTKLFLKSRGNIQNLITNTWQLIYRIQTKQEYKCNRESTNLIACINHWDCVGVLEQVANFQSITQVRVMWTSIFLKINLISYLELVAGDQDTSGSYVELNLSEACSHFILENGGWRWRSHSIFGGHNKWMEFSITNYLDPEGVA